MDKVDAVVTGAGIIGLAIAAALVRHGLETIVLESEKVIGSGISSRNSEVIHAGIYYPTGSLKARACVTGREALYRYCAERGVAHRRCGKLIVAAGPGEIPRLDALRVKAEANGVTDLQPLPAAAVRELEPELHCSAALLSPSSGIIDSHGLMLALQGEIAERGGAMALNSPLTQAVVTEDGFRLQTGGPDPAELGCRILVNAAGLEATQVAARIDSLGPLHIPRLYTAKGNYFALSGRNPFSRLIYPLPEPGGLGVHLTIDLAGQARFGPDVEWVETNNYRVDPARAAGFYAAVRRWWPELADGALIPAYAGIRPKLAGPSMADSDFRIDGPAQHGIPGLVNLFGIESPGLTSCLSLANHVVSFLDLVQYQE